MSTTKEAPKLLRDAIIEVLVGVGVDGMDLDQLDDLIEDTYPGLREQTANESKVMDQLLHDSIVEEIGCSWVRIARSEWERRVAIILADAGVHAGAIGLDAVAKVVMAALMPVSAEDAS